MALLKSILAGVLYLALAVAVLAVLVRLLENRFTFYPWRELEFLPSDFGLSFEDVYLRPAEGQTIHGWYFAPAHREAPVLVIFHGNAGNISHRLEWLAPFIQDGLGALLFDYRGYGRSTGVKPSEKSFREDALAVWEYLAREKRLDPKCLVPFGRSLGGAPAAYLAAERPVRALLLEGTFCRGRDMARQIFGFLPLHLVLKNRWEIRADLARVKVPVMLLHGIQDPVVPFRYGLELAQVCDPKNSVFWPVENGGHLDLYVLLGATYYRRIEEFALSAGAPE